MTNVADLTRTAAVLKALADAVTDRLNAAKVEVEEAFKDSGSTQAVPALPDGTKIATVSYAGGDGQTASVDDEAVFEAWVMLHHSEQCELIIRPEYRKAMLDLAKKEGKAIDPGTGETVPGIVIRPSKPYVSIRFKAGGKEAVAAAWRAGELSEIDVVAPAEIPAAEEAVAQ